MHSAADGITEREIAEFERAGVICLRRLFSEGWIATLRNAVDRRAATSAKHQSKRAAHYSFTELFMWKEDAAFRSFVFESPAAAIAARLLRSRSVRFYFDQIFSKEPGMLAPSPWHNDQPFYPIQGSQICSIWLALDEVTRESSGLEYLAGSHRWPTGREIDAARIESERATLEMLTWDMQPGDCLVHHGLTIHGAGGNSTLDKRRRALATRWIGDDVVYRVREGSHRPLCVPGAKTGDPLPKAQFPEVST